MELKYTNANSVRDNGISRGGLGMTQPPLLFIFLVVYFRDCFKN